MAFLPLSKGADGKKSKPASGVIRPGGDFRLSSFVANDGAATGRYRVTYSAPVVEYPPGAYTPGKPPPQSGFENLVPATAEIEIPPGGGTIDIELVKPAKSG